MNNKYSLLVEENNQDFVIRITEFDSKKKEVLEKEKIDLAAIDLLTSYFENKDELKRHFNLHEDAKVKIVYSSKGEKREVPLVFEDNQLMRHLAYLSYASSSIGEKEKQDPTFRYIVNQFYYCICNPFIREAIYKDYRINLYLKNKIKDYLDSVGEEVYLLKKIEEELLNYKTLRSVVLCLQSYERKNNTHIFNCEIPDHSDILPPDRIRVSRFVPTEDEEEPLFPLNSEEERQYHEYMESLPIENFENYQEENISKKRK